MARANCPSKLPRDNHLEGKPETYECRIACRPCGQGPGWFLPNLLGTEGSRNHVYERLELNVVCTWTPFDNSGSQEPVIFLSICNHWKQELQMIIQGRACEDLFFLRTKYYDAIIVASARCKL